MTDARTPASTDPPSHVIRPTPTSERTVAGIVIAAFVELPLVIILVLRHPPAPQMALYVGVAIVALVVMPLLIALAFASPWLGTEKISAGPAGVSVELNGSKASPSDGAGP